MSVLGSRRDQVFAVLGLSVLVALAIGRTTASSKAVNAKLPEVRLAYFPNLTHAPAVAGVANGEFDRQLAGYRLSTKVVNAGPEAMEALLAGELDFAYVGPSPAINTYVKTQGKAIRIIAGACDGGASLIRRADVKIDSVKDLDGKRVAIPQLGGTQDVSCRTFLAANGLSPTEKGGTVSIIPIKNPDILALFKQKQIDAAWVPEPWASRLKADAGAKTVVDERDLWPDHKFSTTVLVVRTAYAEKYPDVVADVIRAHTKTIAWLQGHPVEAKEVVNKELKRLTGKALSKEVIAEAWSRLEFTAEPNRSSIDAFAHAAFTAGYAKQEPKNLDALIDTTVLAEVQPKAAAAK